MNWPVATAFIALVVMIGIGSAIETFSKNPFTIKLEMDPVAKEMLEYAKSQRVVIVNETLLEGCNLNVTSCATTVIMFAGHSNAPTQFFTNSTVRLDSGFVKVEGFKGKLKTTKAIGDSMKPFMGNVTLLYRVGGGKPQVGDMIIFNATWSEQEKYVVHQVVSIKDEYYTTKGYNNPSRDDHNVSYSNVLGVVVGVLY